MVEMAAPMTDGVSIAVHYYGASPSPAPAVLAFVPYRKESAGTAMLAEIVNRAGCHFLVADVRGFGASVGAYEGLLSRREIDDGVETIAWLASQPFCDGQVAMVGGSYFGANQVLIAARQPPALRCIAPFVNFVDTYRDMTHRGGIPSHAQWGAMTYMRSQQRETMLRGLEHYYLELLADPLDNDGHRQRSPETVLADVSVPTLCLGGWYDYFLRGTVRTYLGVAGPKRLVVGPWGHGGLGDVHRRELVGWLSYWLRGQGDDPTTAGSRVLLWETGAGRWDELGEWPQPSSWTAWSPCGEGAVVSRVLTHLEAVPPAGNVKSERLPDPTDSGMGTWGEDTVLVGPPLESGATIVGPLGLRVEVAFDAGEPLDDVDVYARVSVQDAGGGTVPLTEGRLRMSHRAVDPARSLRDGDGTIVVPWHPHEVEEPLPPAGEPIEITIELDPVYRRVEVGERLVLGVTMTRADEGSRPVGATLLPGTRVLLPSMPG